MRVLYGIALAAAVATITPYAASGAVCSLDQDDYNNYIEYFRDYPSIFNYTLSDEEGLFRESCHKGKMLSYLYKMTSKNDRINFKKSNIKFYVGLHMERKFNNLDYHESIRVNAIGIANNLYDQNLLKDAERFYSGDPESERFVNMINLVKRS